MDFGKLNQIISNFINDPNNGGYLFFLPQIVDVAIDIIKKDKLPTISDEYSRNFDINDSFNIISDFLEVLDPQLNNQFFNIINEVDENNIPKLKFINVNASYYEKYPEEFNDSIKEEMLNKGSRVEWDGNIFVHLTGSMDDIFTILHEILHYMNLSPIVRLDDNNNLLGVTENFTRAFYTETVSIVAEKLLGRYLLSKGLISENDYNIRMNKRLSSTKQDAMVVLIENEYISIKQSNEEISSKILSKRLEEIKADNSLSQVLTEINNQSMIEKATNDILTRKKIQFPIRQRYVIAEKALDSFEYNSTGIEKFRNLHRDVGDINSIFSEVTKSI